MARGITFLGDGEWQASKHGVQGRRQWRKVHLALDTATSDVRAVEFASSSDGDSPVLPDLLDQIPEGEGIGTVTADGACDTRRCHTAIIDREATAIIPIRKNGRPWKEDCPAAIARNETLRATRHYGRRRRAYAAPLGPRSRLHLEALDGIPCPKPDRSEGALSLSLWRAHRRKRPGPPNRRNSDPHRTHEPLLGPRNGRHRSRRLTH